VDGGLRVLVDPALVTTVFGGVDGRQVRRAGLVRERGGRARHKPVVAVHDIEGPVGEQRATGVDDGGAVADQRLRELAHVAREAALDDRRVLPREDQDTRRHAAAQST
jgi:hypothetical protein